MLSQGFVLEDFRATLPASKFLLNTMDNELRSSEEDPPVQLVHRPKRPLSAYNLVRLLSKCAAMNASCFIHAHFMYSLREQFFQAERQKIVSAESNAGSKAEKVKFADMAKIIGAKWKKIDPETKKHFESLAEEEKARHKKALSEWRKMSKQSQKRGSVSSQASTGRAEEALQEESASLEDSNTQSYVQSNPSIEPFPYSGGPSMAINQAQNSQVVSFQNQSSFVQAPASWSFTQQFPQQNATQSQQVNPQMYQPIHPQGTPFPPSSRSGGGAVNITNRQEPLSQSSTERLHERLDELAEVLEKDCVEWLIAAFCR